MKLKIGAVSVTPVLGQPEKNLAMMKEWLEKLSGADLVVFPELFLSGYSIKDRARAVASEIDRKNILDIIADMAEEHGACIIFGSPEVEGENVYNTSILVAPNGKIGKYRKAHLPNFGPFEEDIHFFKGREFPIFETRFGKLAMSICYDVFFPELYRLYALKGATIMTCISASPHISRKYFETLLPARAIENTAFVIYSNLVGIYNSMMFWGGSRIIGPRGDLLGVSREFKEDATVVEIDTREIGVARDFRTTVDDTRPELWEELKNLGGGENGDGDDMREEDSSEEPVTEGR